jgi:hypothetical protein
VSSPHDRKDPTALRYRFDIERCQYRASGVAVSAYEADGKSSETAGLSAALKAPVAALEAPGFFAATKPPLGRSKYRNREYIFDEVGHSGMTYMRLRLI